MSFGKRNPPPRPPTANGQAIERELAALLSRGPEQAFVVFAERGSGKFVQFAGGRGASLLLDLPCKPLSDIEYSRAVSLFRRYGQAVQETDLLDEPGGVPVERFLSFQLDLDADVARAARVALEIFSDVYRLPGDFPLDVTRD